MPVNKFIKFYYDFYYHPNKTLQEFAFLTAMNDINKDKIIADLDINHSNLNNWLYWLAELGSFSCNDIDFLQIPETIIFHGFGDMVVHHSQANLFGNNIKKCHINFIDNCGHAPHIAHCNKIADSIKEFVLN
jgi:pimeloyl-ACP methyl ester carboxylesterase